MNSITNMEVVERMLAEAAVVADIECEGISVSGGSILPRTWDVRPMLDVREHHPISIDQMPLGLHRLLLGEERFHGKRGQ